MPVRALNLYYARDPGVRAEVLSTRLRASAVRAAMAVPGGRVFRRVDGDAELPDVIWDCAFADAAAHDRDMDARAASPEFEAVRAHMRTLTRRFERVLYAFDSNGTHVSVGETIGALIAHAWIHHSDATATDSMSSIAAIASTQLANAANILDRQDDNTRLPEWIIETPARSRAVLATSISSWIAPHPHLRATSFLWERVG
jgi:hypothetical protein